MSNQVNNNNKKRKFQEISKDEKVGKENKGMQQQKVGKQNFNGIEKKQFNGQAQKQTSQKMKGDIAQKTQKVQEEKKIDQSALKKVKSNKKSEELKKQKNDEEEEEIKVGDKKDAASQVIIGDLYSFYSIVEKQPQKMKSMIDSIFMNKESSEEFIIRTAFLYFLELMGITEKDTLQYLCTFISKNTDSKRILSQFTEKLNFSFDKLVFFSQEKKAIMQKKLMKKFCKIYIANIVDMLPTKEQILTSLIEKVTILSKCSLRIVRYTFTYVGLFLLKFLLSQINELHVVERQHKVQLENEELKKKNKNEESIKQLRRTLKTLQAAISIINACLDTLIKHLILHRVKDTCNLVKKSVVDFLHSLDDIELSQCFVKEQEKLFEAVFESLRDEDISIQKTSLSLILKLLNSLYTKEEVNDDEKEGEDLQERKVKGVKEILDINIERNQLYLQKMTIPAEVSDTNKSFDATITIKALQVIFKVVSVMPKVYNKSQIEQISKLVHIPHQGIQEEVGELLLLVASQEQNMQSLLEIQKVNKQQDGEEMLILNFNEEPNKSSQQFLFLVKLISSLKSMSVLESGGQLKLNRKEDNGEDILIQDDEEEEEKRQEHIDKIYKESELQKEGEEKAKLLYQCFSRKTSVLYDIQAMCDLLKSDFSALEDIKENAAQFEQCIEIIANSIFFSIKYSSFWSENASKDYQNTYKKYKENIASYLKLNIMNELIQTHRVNPNVLESLLRAFSYVSSSSVEKEDNLQKIGEDLQYLLFKILTTSLNEGNTNEQEQIIFQLALVNSMQLTKTFPSFIGQLNQLLEEQAQEVKDQLISTFLKKNKDDNGEQEEQIMMIQQEGKSNFNKLFSTLKKNHLMLEIVMRLGACKSSLVGKLLLDKEQHLVVDTASWILNKFIPQFIQQKEIEQLKKKELKSILSMVHQSFELLLLFASFDLSQLKSVQALSIEVFNFYLELIEKRFTKNQQLKTLLIEEQIIETILLLSIEGNQNSMIKMPYLIYNYQENEKISNFLSQLIQQVSLRQHCNDSFSQRQIKSLFKLFSKDTPSFFSKLGLQFFITFGTATEQYILKELRKLLYSFKQRDSLLADQKKSFFYSFFMKAIITLYQKIKEDEVDLFRHLNMSKQELQKLFVNEKQEGSKVEMRRKESGGSSSIQSLSIENFGILKVLQMFIKNVLFSIMMVNFGNRNKKVEEFVNGGLPKNQEEFAYFKMVEDFCKFFLNSKDHYFALNLVKGFINKSFLPLQYQDSLVAGLQMYMQRLEEQGRIQEEADKVMLRTIIEEIKMKCSKSLVKKGGQNKEKSENVVKEVAEEGGEEDDEKAKNIELQQEQKDNISMEKDESEGEKGEELKKEEIEKENEKVKRDKEQIGKKRVHQSSSHQQKNVQQQKPLAKSLKGDSQSKVVEKNGEKNQNAHNQKVNGGTNQKKKVK